jgi:acetyltransferase-like isoleucine patch superfamily enzyme
MVVDHLILFGHNSAFGDILEIAHLNYLVVTEIYLNQPPVVLGKRPQLTERLDRFLDQQFNPHGVNQYFPIAVRHLNDFQVDSTIHYSLGFSGIKGKSLVDFLKLKYSIVFKNLIHPSAIVKSDIACDQGLVIQAGTLIGRGVDLGSHLFINKSNTIGDGVLLADYVTTGPGVTIGNNAVISEGVHLGIGAYVMASVVINSGVIVGAGACVDRDLLEPGLYVGKPLVKKK